MPDGFIDNKGTVHRYLRNLVLSLIGSHKLKNNHISEIDLNIRKRWAVQDEVDVKEASEIVIIDLLFISKEHIFVFLIICCVSKSCKLILICTYK